MRAAHTALIAALAGNPEVRSPLAAAELVAARDAEVHTAALLKGADAINALPQDYECDPGRGDAAELLRRMAAAGQAPAPQPEMETTPDPAQWDRIATALTREMGPGSEVQARRLTAVVTAVLAPPGTPDDDRERLRQQYAAARALAGNLDQRGNRAMDSDLCAAAGLLRLFTERLAVRDDALTTAQLRDAEQRIAAALALHREVDGSPHSEGSCIEDGQDWPCATRRALTGGTADHDGGASTQPDAEPLPVRWDRTVIHPDDPDDDTLVCCIATDDTRRPVALFLDDELREALGASLLDPNAEDDQPDTEQGGDAA